MRLGLGATALVAWVITGCTGTTGGSTSSSSSGSEGGSSGSSSSAARSSSRAASHTSSSAPGSSSSSESASATSSAASSSSVETPSSSEASSTGGSSSESAPSTSLAAPSSSEAAPSSSARNYFGSSSGDSVGRPGPCTTTRESPPDHLVQRTTFTYEGGVLSTEARDLDLDGLADVTRTHQYQPDGLLGRVVEDNTMDGLPDVEEVWAYGPSGAALNITRSSLVPARVLQFTAFAYDAQGRLATTTQDDFNDGIIDASTTRTYAADGSLLSERVTRAGQSLDCALAHPSSVVETRTCRDVATQVVAYVETRFTDAQHNLLGTTTDAAGDGTVEEVLRADHACFSQGGTSSSSSASGPPPSSSSAVASSSSAAPASSSGPVPPPCVDVEKGPTTFESPQVIPRSCSTWDLQEASVFPLGDQDHFLLTLAPGQTVVATTWVGAPGLCGTADTVLDVLAPVGPPPPTAGYCGAGAFQLACDDDRGVDACSTVTFSSPAGGDFILRVSTLGNGSALEQYGLQVKVTTPGCGNGLVEPGESCDDGNHTAGDGCGASCALEGDTCASPIAVTLGPQPLVFSNLTTVGQGANVTASCAATSSTAPDTLYSFTASQNGALTAVLQGLDGFDGVLNLVSGTCASGTSVACRNATAGGDSETLQAGVAAGTSYWLSVDGVGAAVGRYNLSLSLTPAACGNGVVEPGEGCDDGNLVSGDGCSATCTGECTVVGGPDPTIAAPLVVPSGCTTFMYTGGTISPVGDWDHFRITLRAGQRVTPLVFATSTTVCPPSINADLVVQLRRAPVAADPTALYCSSTDATRLACNDAYGCDTFNYTATTAGDYIVSVLEYGNNATVSTYGLQLTFQ